MAHNHTGKGIEYRREEIGHQSQPIPIQQATQWQYLHEILESDNVILAQNQDDFNEVIKFKMVPYSPHPQLASQESVPDISRYSTQDFLPTGASPQDDREREYKENKATVSEVILKSKHEKVNENDRSYNPLIGQGTFGAVYRALMKGEKVEKQICVKQAKDFDGDLGFKTLEREVRALKSCRGHERIIECFGLYRSNDYTFLLLEYFTGTPLSALIYWAKVLKDGTPVARFARAISRTESLKIMIQTLEGLAYLHGSGIIHYDIKPENLLYSRDHKMLKLIDFGLATSDNHPETKQRVHNRGTLDYMAPEVMAGKFGGDKSDVFSSGATFFHMTTLTRPYNNLEHIKLADDKQKRKELVQLEVRYSGTRSLQEYVMEYTDSDEDIRGVICKLLCNEYDARPDIMATIDHLVMLEWYSRDSRLSTSSNGSLLGGECVGLSEQESLIPGVVFNTSECSNKTIGNSAMCSANIANVSSHLGSNIPITFKSSSAFKTPGTSAMSISSTQPESMSESDYNEQQSLSPMAAAGVQLQPAQDDQPTEFEEFNEHFAQLQRPSLDEAYLTDEEEL